MTSAIPSTATPTRAHRVRNLAMAYLRDTECKAVPIDEIGQVLLRVERFGQRMLFRFLRDTDPDPHPAYAAAVVPVRSAAEMQDVLEGCRWQRGLRDA